MITYKIRLEMAGGREQYSNMEFTTGDVQAYRLEFDFMDNGKAYDCTGHTLTVKAKRLDGSVVVDSGAVEDGKAFYVPANSVYAVEGALELEVALVTADGSYATVKVIHAHVREGFGDGDVTPEDTTPILVNLIAQGEYAKQMGDYAKEQGEWVGEAANAHINDNVRHITAEERAGWNNKVDKTEGKGLSDNNYTDADKIKLDGIEAGAEVNGAGYSTIVVEGVGDIAAQEPYDRFVLEAGDNVAMTRYGGGEKGVTISATDTTYENATETKAGLMSSADKVKLNGIETGAEKNVVTSVAGKTGAVVLDKSDVGLENLTNDKQAKETDFNAHVGNTSNPHNVTKEQLEIENVDNTSDMDKPVSTAQAAALALKADKADFDAHDADGERHITAAERARWDASAIVGDASGEKIVLDDIAPQGAIRELEIYGKSEQDGEPTPETPIDIVSAENFNALFLRGKNLLDTTGVDNVLNGVAFERQSDGSVKVSGTSTALAYTKHINITSKLTVGKTYTKSWKGGVTGLSFVLSVIKKDGTVQYPTTFTFDSTMETVKLYLQITNAGVTVDTTVYPQLEEGSVATAYEPYGGTVVNIPYELRGVPNTTGGWLARDYIMVKDGAVKLVRECKEKTFDGTEVWFPYNPGGVDISSIGYTFYHILNDGAIGFQKSRCTHFKNVNNAWVAGYKDTYGIYSCSSSAGVKYFRAPDASITTVDGFKAWLAEKSAADDPVKLLYTLLAPTVEDITDTETGQALLALTLTAPDAAISNTAASGMAVYYEVDGTIAYKKLASAIVALGGTI